MSLSTMTSNDKVVRCQRYRGLEVQGINSSKKIHLPQVYSRKSIPINYQHIPCEEMIESWPHLFPLRGKLSPKLNLEVGILIGYDCPEALFPREVINAPKSTGGPFGQKSDLGWGIVGTIGKPEKDNIDQIGVSHRIVAKHDTGSQIVLQKQTKEIVSPADCLKLLERDFFDSRQHEEGSSADERRFLRAMEEGVTVDSSRHYSMPLPFNDKISRLFNNKKLVLTRVNSLKRKLNRDSKV